jgi:signal transduction histidine kinase
MHIVVDRVRRLWNGPDDLPRSLKLEWRFVAVRWLGIGLIAPVLLLLHLPPERLIAAYALLGIASAYNAVLEYMLPRRASWLANGYLSTIGDGLLNVALVVIGGGFDSPFYLTFFTVTLAAAMRYGYGPSLGVASGYVAADAIGYVLAHQEFGGPFVFRSVLLPLTTVLAGYLREQAQRAEAALQERLRQSNALNEATAVLGASLELDSVLRAAVGATAQLFGSETAVLLAADTLDGFGGNGSEPIFHGGNGTTPLELDLLELCRAHADHDRFDDELITVHQLAWGGQAILLELALPTRQTALATLGVAVPASTTITLDSDILDQFVERITLAVENASLYRTLADRSQDLQRAYSDLATAHQDLLSVDEMKTNFLANVSHELRTPLTSIRSFAELLLAYEDDPEVQKEFLRIISTESERLTRLVNDVLDISRIEAGHMAWKMDSIDVAEFVGDLARTFTPLVDLAQLTFDLDLGADLGSIYGDRDRLHQVVSNLLNNATKFTRPGGTIVLTAERHEAEIHIAVADTGIGIDASDQERIFEKFQQVGDTLTDKPRGTGLGLAICRDIVEHHQGRLWVDSKPGVGSRFTVALPLPADLAAAA